MSLNHINNLCLSGGLRFDVVVLPRRCEPFLCRIRMHPVAADINVYFSPIYFYPVQRYRWSRKKLAIRFSRLNRYFLNVRMHVGPKWWCGELMFCLLMQSKLWF